MSESGVVEVALPIVAVTVQEDRAAITRRGSVKLAAGQHRLAIASVAPVLADKSLSATATGARVLDVRCERTVAPWREPGADAEPARLREQRDAHERARADAEARAKVAAAQATALAQLGGAAWRDLAVDATRGSAVADGASARFAELDGAAGAAAARATDAAFDAELASRALGRLDARLARAEAEAGTLAARVLVDVLVEGTASELALEVTYAVPCAAWRPHHRATLDGDRVVVRTDACVWQATGEDWRDATLTFSLERASLGVEPPALFDEMLATRKRAEVLAVETREQDVQTTGLGGGDAVVPGIDDGGLGLVLRGTRAVTIRSDGTPHRVPVGEVSAPAELALIAMPPVSPWVHVRARFANTGTVPLLAGPVDLIMSSGYVGQGELGFVSPGEAVELGFGPEPDVRVHRDERRERDDAGLLGGWNVQTVRVAVRISNLGGSKRKLIVQERVPVSEVEQVEIAIGKPGAYAISEAGVAQVTERTVDERGLVTWNLELPPRARRVVTVEYQIKSRKDVAGL